MPSHAPRSTSDVTTPATTAGPRGNTLTHATARTGVTVPSDCTYTVHSSVVRDLMGGTHSRSECVGVLTRR